MMAFTFCERRTTTRRAPDLTRRRKLTDAGEHGMDRASTITCARRAVKREGTPADPQLRRHPVRLRRAWFIGRALVGTHLPAVQP